MARTFACLVHRGGVVDEGAAELVTAASRIDASAGTTAILAGWGPDLDAACESVRGLFAEVWKIAHESLAYPNAELVRQALLWVLPHDAIVLALHDHFGVDLAPGLSVKLNVPYVPDLIGIDARDGATLLGVRQEFGGQVNVHVRCDVGSGAVMTVRPGAFPPADRARASAEVVDMSPALGALAPKRRHVSTIAPAMGDVDITKHAILVSIGRGIQGADNVPLAEELAQALGGAVSCSRPVVDAKWLDKSRQVGSSGKTVKPKVYLACGISGSFQHLAGLKGHPLIVAVNKNPKAPIFRVADVGIVDDILEFLPALTERVREHVAV